MSELKGIDELTIKSVERSLEENSITLEEAKNFNKKLIWISNHWTPDLSRRAWKLMQEIQDKIEILS